MSMKKSLSVKCEHALNVHLHLKKPNMNGTSLRHESFRKKSLHYSYWVVVKVKKTFAVAFAFAFVQCKCAQ